MPFDARGCWYRRPPSLVCCRECGTTVNAAEWVNVGELERERLCNDCLKWMKLTRFADRPEVVRVGGVHYIVHPDDAENWRGSDAREYHVRFLDGRELQTTNLWSQGVIPARWRERLPDNAVLCD